jgi:hypothetical protein
MKCVSNTTPSLVLNILLLFQIIWWRFDTTLIFFEQFPTFFTYVDSSFEKIKGQIMITSWVLSWTATETDVKYDSDIVNRSQSISNAYLVFGQVWLLFFWCMVMMRLSWYCARGHLERQDRICWSNQSKQNFCNTADIKWLVGAMFWLHLSNFNKIQFFIP